MASEFIALPLTSGESFLLCTERDGRTQTILVDSGKKFKTKKHALVQAIQSVCPKLTRIDICVCTHHDSDHSNGFSTFPDVWCAAGNTIGEFWLPGRWAAAVPAVLKNPIAFVQNIALGADKVLANMYDAERIPGEVLRNKESLEEIASHFGEVKRNSNDDFSPTAASSLGLTEDEVLILDAWLEEDEASDLGTFLDHVFWWPLTRPAEMAFISEAVETAEIIRKICAAALRWRIPIRWFDFGLYEATGIASGGISNLLEPVCSVELTKPPRVSNEILFRCLKLSRQNVESLVFLSPESEAEPAVLFLGDSRLAFGIGTPGPDFQIANRKPLRRLLATAPHHGSNINDHAYGVVNSWLGKSAPTPIYVRNGGQSNQKLGNFKKLKHRACAQCIKCHGKTWSQQIVVTTKGNDWVLPIPQKKKCK